MAERLLEELCRGRRSVVWWQRGVDWQPAVPSEFRGVLAGSFDPLHDGHRGLLRVAAERLGGEIVAEITLINADKPPLSAAQVVERCRQFRQHAVAVTCAATFVEKSRLFPGVTFVVGADTAERIVHRRFYADDPQQRDDALAAIAQQNCRFLVAARGCGDRLLRLKDLCIPERQRRLFAEIPPALFRFDVSSTELRHQQSLERRPGD